MRKMVQSTVEKKKNIIDDNYKADAQNGTKYRGSKKRKKKKKHRL